MGKTRRRLTVELITELQTINKKIKTADKDLRDLVTARGSTLLDLHDIGPADAARLLADVGDIHRFTNRDRFASWNGTAPLDASSGEQQRQRALKRRLFNVVYTRMLTNQKRREAAGPGGHSGTTLQSSVTGLTPDTGPSDKPQSKPVTNQPSPATTTP